MALTRESINGKHDARVTALGTRPSKYRQQPKYTTNRYTGKKRLIGYTRESNGIAVRNYNQTVNRINRDRNLELQRFEVQHSNLPQWAITKAQRAYGSGSGYPTTTITTLAKRYVAAKNLQADRIRQSSITTARSNAVDEEQQRRAALRKLLNNNRLRKIRSTTAQNQKVKQDIESAGYDPSKLQRAGIITPSPRKESVSNEQQRIFARQQVGRAVDETVITSSSSSSEQQQQSEAALIIATQTKKRHDSIIQQAKQRYKSRQQVKLNPALISAVPMKFPELIKYSKQPTTIATTTTPPPPPLQRNPFDEFSFNDVKKPESRRIGSPHQEYAKGFRSGLDDLYITGENTVRYVKSEPLKEQKGNPLDNLIFAPLDAGIQSYDDNSDFAKNFNERVDKITKGFWDNPAYSVGSAVPSALIIGASVIVPPVAAVKYGINILPKIPKITQVITKTAKVGSKVSEKVPRSLNKGKYAIGDEKSFAEATSKVPRIDKNRIRTNKATSYKVNPNLLIRKDNVLAKEIGKGVDMEPYTIKDFFGKTFVNTMKNKARNTRKTSQKKNLRKLFESDNHKQFKSKEPKTKGTQQTKREKSEFEKMYGKSFLKEIKRQSVEKTAQDNFKISSDIMRLGNKVKTQPLGFGKVVKNGRRQQLVTKTKAQLRQDKLIQQQKSKLHDQKVKDAKNRYKLRQQTGKTVKNQTQKLKDFWNTGKNGQVTKQVSKTVRKGAKTGSKSKSKGTVLGARVGVGLGLLNAVRGKQKKRVRPILEDIIKNPLKDKSDSKQDDKSTFVYNLKFGNGDSTKTKPIMDDPPIENSIFVPTYRPPTTPTTQEFKIPKYPSRKFGSGFGFWGGSSSRPKKIYTTNKIGGIFESTQIGKSIDSRTIPLDDYDKIMKSKKKKSFTGMTDYGLSKTKSKKKIKSKKLKRNDFGISKKTKKKKSTSKKAKKTKT